MRIRSTRPPARGNLSGRPRAAASFADRSAVGAGAAPGSPAILSDESSARMVRAGALAIVIANFINLIEVTVSPGATPPWQLACVWALLAVGAVTAALSLTNWFTRHWRPLSWLLGVAVVACATALGVGAGKMELLYVSLVLMIMGPGTLLPWSPAWQGSFGAICIAAWGAGVMLSGFHDADAASRWIGILTAGGLAQFTTVRRKRAAAQQSAANSAIRDSEAELRKIFEASPDVIAITRRADGALLDVNPAFERAGFARAEALGKSARTFEFWVHPEERRRYAGELAARGRVSGLEASFRLRDGSVEAMLVSAVTVELSGEPCVVTVAHSIAALKETQRQLEDAREQALAASRAKSDFLSTMSHEIRTPLNAILGMTDLLLETELSGEQRKYLNTMAENGTALVELISDILDLARIESGRLELNIVGFDLEELLDRVLETLGVRAHARGLELAGRILAEVPTALAGDPMRLRQILVNLIGNATKFTEQGEVVVTVAAEANGPDAATLHFSVTDTGIGIDREQVESIFGAFTQVDSSISRKYGGTGLGLAIARRLVELVGGRIWVESEPGRGSTFHFTARFGRTEPGPAHGAAPNLAGVRVLVVDDTAINRLIAREILAALGVRAAEAGSGAEALEALTRARSEGDPFRVVLLDSRMAGENALALAQRIRDEDAADAAVVVMLTSDDLPACLQRMRAAGLAHYLVKPIRRSELIHAVAGALRKTPDPHAPASTADARTDQTAVRALRILLVDDSADNRHLIAAYLRNTAHQLEHAENGALAVERFASARFDLVLMDIQMPVMDGHAATRAMRQWERASGSARTPIVALTAAALADSVAQCLEAGCDAHLAKPIKKATLLEVIRRVAAGPPGGGSGPGHFGEIHSGAD
jgi:two-component system, sensor histidine kinase and response regulator